LIPLKGPFIGYPPFFVQKYYNIGQKNVNKGKMKFTCNIYETGA